MRRSKKDIEEIIIAEVEAKLAGMKYADRQRMLTRLQLRQSMDNEDYKESDKTLVARILGRK